MSTIAERIKEVRKSQGLTQQKFADRIGIKQNTIATYEMGRNNPIDPVVNAICREFNVNEAWLREGEGEMYRDLSRDEQLAEAFGRMLAEDDSDEVIRMKKAIINELLAMPPEAWEHVLTFLKNISGN